MIERDVITELVQRLGGAVAIAPILGCDRQAVSKWRILGRVPWKYRHMVRKIAFERGIALTSEEFSVLSLEPERQAS